MSDDIKVGDVAEIIACCCDWHRGAIGLYGEVIEFGDEKMECDHCGFSCTNNAHMIAPDGRRGSVPLKFLRKRRPPADDSEWIHQEIVPLERFNEWRERVRRQEPVEETA